MRTSIVRGFIQLPLLFLILGLTAVGGYTAIKVPEILEEREFKQITRDTTLPLGSSSAGEILVAFRSGVSTSQRDNIHKQGRTSLKSRLTQINTDAITLPTGATLQETLDYYLSLENVEYAEPNFLAAALLTPNDALFSKQWNLQTILSEESYDVSQGGYGPIAIIDTGVDPNHPDLAGLVTSGLNTIDGSSNTTDDHGHGTLVAGIASAKTNNSHGIASISFESSILPVKVLGADGSGTYDNVAEGIIYAADSGARIINLSLGGTSDSKTLKRAVDYALGRGSLLVAAAGNSGTSDTVYPAAYSGVLSVTASDSKDNLASFSSFGNNTFVSSPGVSIISAFIGDTYKEVSGTSMSAPHLAGLIALVLSQDPSFDNSQVIEHIKNNAEKVGPYAYDSNGWNPYFGYGRLSAGRTLTAIAQLEPSPEDEPSPTPTASPAPTGSTTPHNPPRSYTLSFATQGVIENTYPQDSRLTIQVSGGTPNIMTMLSGNLVDIYLDLSTTIKYQGSTLTLESLTPGTQLHVRGTVQDNKLIASDIIVQRISSSTPETPTINPVVPAPAETQNNNPSSPSDIGDTPSTNPGNAPNLPEQSQGRGRVQGASTQLNFWQRALSALLGY